MLGERNSSEGRTSWGSRPVGLLRKARIVLGTETCFKRAQAGTETSRAHEQDHPKLGAQEGPSTDKLPLPPPTWGVGSFLASLVC